MHVTTTILLCPFIPLSELKVTRKFDPWLSSSLVTWTVSGLMVQRVFKEASTTLAEAVTGIGPKKKRKTRLVNKHNDWEENKCSNSTLIYPCLRLRSPG